MNSPEKSRKNLSGIEIQRCYGAEDIRAFDAARDLGVPGVFPFTRGIYSTMYRGRLWTMRQFAGFGSAEESNRRYHYLLQQGNMGLSVAFDMPTLMGYDSDDPRSRGEVGRCGVAVDSVTDMEVLFRGIPLDNVSVSMTINGPAIVLFAMYLVVAERQGVKFRDLQGTLQNDILKEYIAQKEWICPPAPSLKMINDIIGFCVESAPRYHPLSISGYHIREAGSTAVQAARRLWAHEIKKRFHPANPDSLALRFHTQTAGCALTAQQPYNNVVRVTLQALAAVLGGTQSLHTNSLDETLALPSEDAVKIALRTQQIIAHESGVTDTADPLGGSYYVEWLTDKMESEAKSYFDKLDAMRGMVPAIERGFPQGEIHRAAVSYQKEVDARERIIVGVNSFVEPERSRVSILKVKDAVEKKQVLRLRQRKKSRSAKKVGLALNRLGGVAEASGDLMPAVMEAVRAEATVGEICEVFRRVYGGYREAALI